MKFGQKPAYLITNISNMFLDQCGAWKLVSVPFVILMKWQYNEIFEFLLADIYHLKFSLIHLFKKMKHWKLEIIGY